MEYGIANEMEQYESNHKVQQLMGDKGDNRIGADINRSKSFSTTSVKK